MNTSVGVKSRALIMLLALLGLGVGALLLGGAILVLRSSATAAQVYIPLAVEKTLGTNAELGSKSQEEIEASLATMESTGLVWLRQRFAWDLVESEQGVYDWSTVERIVDAARRHNVKIVAVLDGAPAWARALEDTGNALAPPVENRDFGEFAQKFASRYGDVIDFYQIWDEPNIEPHWGAREVDPAAYARLLREGAIRIRAADPGATILAPALAPNVESGGANLSDILFLDRLYELEAGEWFDAVSAQIYDYGEPADSPADPNQLNWNRALLLRDTMVRHGDSESAVWTSAFGSSGAKPETVDELLGHARTNWPWMGPMFWTAWAPDDARGEYSLIGADGNPGRVAGALRRWGQAPVVAWPGVYRADHPSGQYSGDWRVAPSGADIGASSDRLLIAFEGTRLDLAVRRGEYRAWLYASIDGQPASALPRDEQGRAFVSLYDPLHRTDMVRLAEGLADGQHRAELIAERGWGQWALVGWSVTQGGQSLPASLPRILAVGALVVLGLTLGWTWVQRSTFVNCFANVVDYYRGIDMRLGLLLTGGALVLVYAVAGLVPTLAALTLLFALLILRPEIGLPLIAATLPFYQLGVTLEGMVFSLVEVLILLTLVGWTILSAFELSFRRGSETKPTRGLRARLADLSVIDWGVLALVGVALLSLLWAGEQRVALREFRVVVLEAAIFYWLLRAMTPGRREAWLIVDAWVLGATAIALFGLFQWAFGLGLIDAGGVWRVRGFYGSPNNLALYLGRVLPTAVAIGAFATAKTGSLKANGRRWAYALAAVLILATLFLTYSRGAWLIGVPASILFVAALRGRKALVTVLGAVIILAVIAVLVMGPGRLISVLDTSEGTTFFRIQLWKSSLAMIGDYPLTGVGLDNFLYQYRSHYAMPSAWEELNLSHPHNIVMDSWLRLGLLGLVVMAGLLVAFFRKGLRSYRCWVEGSDRLLILGLMGGMVGFVAHGLVDNAYFLVDLAFVFSLMLALVQLVPAGTEDVVAPAVEAA